MTILVVEDEAVVSSVIREALEDRGLACLVAGDVDEAEWILKSAAVDAIALDLGLPGRDAMRWLEALCLERPDLARATVVMTGRDLEAEDTLRIQSCGAIALRKPFRIADLHAAVMGRVACGDDRSTPPPRAPAAGGELKSQPGPRGRPGNPAE